MADQNPFLLAANGPELDPRLIQLLQSRPELASKQDEHGYSLLHAAASYHHPNLLRLLVQDYNVDVNLRDEDGETCLFVAETVDIAKCLIHELKVDTSVENDEGLTAAQKIEAEGDFPELSEYLQQQVTSPNGDAGQVTSDQSEDGVGRLPPLPPNVKLNLGTVMNEDEAGIEGQQPDPEFRRRIEELASKENFHTEQGQQELRDLITDAMRGVNQDEEQESRRRRVG